MKKKLLASLIASCFVTVAHAQELPLVSVVEQSPANSVQKVSASDIKTLLNSTSDVTGLLKQSPSVSVNQAGGVSGFPVMRGIADHRLDVQVDGMRTIATCPNHMNPALSYVSPSNVESIEIYPGVTPVSVGGDSIGGSILVNTKDPMFAPKGEQVTSGELNGYYRSNGNAKGGDVSVTTASDRFNLTYKGSYAESENYKAAKDFKTFTTTTNAPAGTIFTSGTEGTTTSKDEVAGTAYQVTNHDLSLAYKGDDSLLIVGVKNQSMPYQQYPNQRMDMTQNDSNKLNVTFEKQMNWGQIDLQAYHETVDHEMAFMDYKISMQMPMASKSTTNGFKLSAVTELSAGSALTMGTEIQQYELQDYWDPNMGAPGMRPNVFLNIKDGTRDRYAAFAEWEKQLNAQWKTRVGARYERVNTNAGDVHGYHDTNSFTAMKLVNGVPTPINMTTNEATESAAFNAKSHAKTDDNLNLTALANYEFSKTFDVDMGLARQVRSPDLYERYTWSTWSMAALMNNVVGDGNGYLGDINLKPETAYTLSTNFDWHAANQKDWGLQVMPYFSYIENYIDAVLQRDYAPMGSDFDVLQYKNQTAQIYGLDVAANRELTQNSMGNWAVKAKVNYARGTNEDTNNNLYNIMPLNGTFTLSQKMGGWNNAVEWVVVADKTETSKVRNELETKGYHLINLRASYAWKKVRIDAGVENLMDTAYDLPTGGAYTGEGKTMSISGVKLMNIPGAGRNLYAGLNIKF